MAFLLYLLVNAVLIIRPPEIIPDLETVPLYSYAIAACMLVAIPALLDLLMPNSILSHATFYCLFGIGLMVCVAHSVNSDTSTVVAETLEFGKVVIYVLLMVALVNTPRRLVTFISAMSIFGAITTSVALLQYHEVISIATLKTANESVTNKVTLTDEVVRRLQVTGILQDPNEFCIFLGVHILFTIFLLTNERGGAARVLWAIPLAMFIYAAALTYSRGGLLSILVGLSVFATYRYGGRRTIMYGLLVLPVLFVGFAGRQTEVSLSEGTAQTRVQVWSDWLDDFRASPIVGNEPKVVPPMLDKETMKLNGFRHFAHNSFLQAFADLGVLGGMCFVGMFVCAFATLHRFGFNQVYIEDPEMRQMLPYLMGAVAGYTVGLMTLTLCYVITTYYVIGLPIVFGRVTRTYPAMPTLGADGKLVARIGYVGFGLMLFLYVFVRVFRNY